jgi:type IV secretion system protein VirD4
MDGLALGFQPQLGRPGSGCSASDLPAARLLLVVVWLRRLCAVDLRRGAYIAASGGFISVAVAIGMSVWRAREAKKVETYGSARWAEKDEVKARACSARMASCSAATTRLSSP